MDSGFDLFVPKQTVFETPFKSEFIDFGIKAEMVFYSLNCISSPTAFTIHPHSSLSKTPLMLANHTGIIDAGYRGSLIGAFRCLGDSPYVVEQNTRLVQICHPSLCPIYVEIVSSPGELTDTSRGSGAFGSTGC